MLQVTSNVFPGTAGFWSVFANSQWQGRGTEGSGLKRPKAWAALCLYSVRQSPWPHTALTLLQERDMPVTLTDEQVNHCTAAVNRKNNFPPAHDHHQILRAKSKALWEEGSQPTAGILGVEDTQACIQVNPRAPSPEHGPQKVPKCKWRN